MKEQFLAFSVILISLAFVGSGFAGPYAPAAGETGSTAIPMDAPAFLAWANGVEDYNPGATVDPQWQTPEEALGKAEGTSDGVVSLGEGGSITLTFSRPIVDGPGYDFAVFENAFNDTFLELAYVEVSSDGVNFYRFDNNSLTPGPVGGYGGIDPTNIFGYGGKYRQGYGTPFDLDLSSFSQETDPGGLDVNHIRWVRIIDIIGDGSCRDSFGGIIYDPYPTTGSAGFDLDAVGVIHEAGMDPDRDGDGDVDGEDLAAYALDPGDIIPADFAADFGRE